jgi:hypothetical protein
MAGPKEASMLAPTKQYNPSKLTMKLLYLFYSAQESAGNGISESQFVKFPRGAYHRFPHHIFLVY